MKTDQEELTVVTSNKRKHVGPPKNPRKRKQNKTLMAIKEEVEEEICAEDLANKIVPEGAGEQNPMEQAPEGPQASASCSSNKDVPVEEAFYTTKALSDLKVLFTRVKYN